jgi:predicted O-methyltransferase YrrM
MGSPPVKGFGQGDPALARWVEETFAPEDPVLAEIRERSTRAGLPTIAVGRMDGLHLEVITRAVCAKKAVEIGTLGGYSGVCIARGMGPDGFLHTIEMEPRHAEVAASSFERAGVAGIVKIHVGRAQETLAEIEGEGPFDLVFVDADKGGYAGYVTTLLDTGLLAPHGLIAVDNTLLQGEPWLSGAAGSNGAAIAAFNDTVAADPRVEQVLLPLRDGLTLIRRSG